MLAQGALEARCVIAHEEPNVEPFENLIDLGSQRGVVKVLFCTEPRMRPSLLRTVLFAEPPRWLPMNRFRRLLAPPT